MPRTAKTTKAKAKPFVSCRRPERVRPRQTARQTAKRQGKALRYVEQAKVLLSQASDLVRGTNDLAYLHTIRSYFAAVRADTAVRKAIDLNTY